MDALRILLTACGATTTIVLFHGAISRTTLRGGTSQLYLLVLMVLALTLAIGVELKFINVLYAPAVAALVLCFSLAYIHWYVAMFRSLSIRILNELQSANGTLTLEELDRVYPVRWMFTSRLENLEAHGWIVSVQGTYRCTVKGRHIARSIQFLRRLYGIERAG